MYAATCQYIEFTVCGEVDFLKLIDKYIVSDKFSRPGFQPLRVAGGRIATQLTIKKGSVGKQASKYLALVLNVLSPSTNPGLSLSLAELEKASLSLYQGLVATTESLLLY